MRESVLEDGSHSAAERTVEQRVREQLRRDAIDAAHFFGLAALYDERGKKEQAAECLEIARRKEAFNPYVHKLHGKILFRRRELHRAAEELRLARRFNPFDRETAEILGRVEYERERYTEALEATIDAFLLIDDDDRENGNRLKRRIRTLKSIQKISGEDIVELFHTRRGKLQTDFDRLEWQREQLLRRDETDRTQTLPTVQTGQLQLAGRLRKLDIWSNLSDDQVFLLSRATHAEVYPKGSTIFESGGEGADIYTLESGEVLIRRPTSYGVFPLGTLNAGAVFGEVNFIAEGVRSGEAVAKEECHVLRLDARELDILIDKKPDLGVALYSLFWHGLAHKLRAANEKLRTFFSAAPGEGDAPRLERAKGGLVDVEASDKIALLEEQGLTGSELNTLAKFSEVKRFDGGANIFHEGDQGKEMYAILDGAVRISKYIAGGGEEALAILHRGDFFGEMSLIDGAPRSADAQAHQGPVTLVAFDDRTIRDVMAGDPHAALELMKLLCRLLCQRLREIDEKVTSWHIMAGVSADVVLEPQ